MQDFRQLNVWKKSHSITLAIYKVTKSFPTQETYGLISQMQRAAVSISANIAEGCGKRTDPDFARYLQISMGSASELDYLLLLASDLGYLSPDTYASIQGNLIETRKMLNGLIQTVRSKR